jgi:hypothetical protein
VDHGAQALTMTNPKTFQLGALAGIIAVSGALAIAGCHRDEGGGPGAAASASAASSGVPTPQDYEAKAKTEITPDNLDDQLNAIDKDIAGDNRK